MKALHYIIHLILGVFALFFFSIYFAIGWVFGMPVKFSRHGKKLGTLRWFTYTRAVSDKEIKDLRKNLKNQVNKYTNLLQKAKK